MRLWSRVCSLQGTARRSYDGAMSESSTLRGIWPAMLSPLAADHTLDRARFVAHGQALLAAGCAGLTPFGTTGEGPSFSLEERQRGVEALLEGGIAPARLLVSTFCAGWADTLLLTRHAVALGAWACLVMPPYFYKGVSEAGIVEAYRRLIEGVADARLRLLLYHLPQVAGVGLTAGVIETLRRDYPQTIVGIKDSGCDIAQSLAWADAFMPALPVHVGNEPDLPALARRGSAGAVSGLANVIPRVVQRLVAEPDSAAARRDLERVHALLGVLNRHALLPAIKAMMARASGDAAWLRVRAPLMPLTDTAQAELDAGLRVLAFDRTAD
jgi:4-hydroxy-tetrahydrodipicolinate synthase